MPLRLIITSYHKLTPGQRADFELDRGELKIGRNPENDWVLPDPERLVSGQHCLIQLREGIYYLTDTSTNGVQLVNAGVRMHRGNSEALQDGELLRLGEYEILVQISAPAVSAMPGSGAQNSDPFASLGLPSQPAASAVPAAPAPPPATAQLRAGGSPLDTKPDLFDFLASPAVPAPTQADHVPAERHDFRPPQPVAAPVPAPPISASPAIPADWDPFAEPGSTPAPTFTSAPAPAPIPEIAAAPPTPPEVLAAPAFAPPVLPPSGQGDAALEAFLRGAGLTQLRIDQGEALAQMETIGRSYRRMVEGLIEVLRARASLKGEFRMAQTMIRPVENNPLKFAPNVEEALVLLLRSGNQAFMPADLAISESFDDLKAHQLAVMAGVQASIKHLLKRFEPAVLEARLTKPAGIGALLPGGRQAQYWALFTQLYAGISREAEDDFEELFGREFGRAYEEQSAKLHKG